MRLSMQATSRWVWEPRRRSRSTGTTAEGPSAPVAVHRVVLAPSGDPVNHHSGGSHGDRSMDPRGTTHSTDWPVTNAM